MNGVNIVAVDETGRRTLELTAETETVIDSKYKIVALIGEGGMGAVYKAHHLLLQKDVALKTFRTRNLSTEVWQRFQREAQSIARLKHKNIVQVFDFGVTDEKVPYYTMPLLIGESLAQRLERVGHLSVIESLEIFLQVADALDHAHSHNIVHRDIKPGNIFLEQVGAKTSLPSKVKLVDFGIAKLVVADQSEADTQSLTAPGVIFGSPLYMSPEQCNGFPIDSRSDIYSFGCALFEALTGEPPFAANSAMATMLCHINQDPPQLRDLMGDALPPRLNIVMIRLLSKNPDRRYQSFAEVKNDMRFCLTGTANAREKELKVKKFNQAELLDRTAENVRLTSKGQTTNLSRVAGFSFAIFFCLSLLLFFIMRPAQSPIAAAHSEGSSQPSETTAVEPSEVLKGRAEALSRQSPFLTSGSSGARKVYEFPTYASIGRFTLAPDSEGADCRGLLTWKESRRPMFKTGEEILKAPKLFLRFKHDDFSGLIFTEPLDINQRWTLDKLQYICHMKELITVDLNKCNFDGSILPLLESFPYLMELKISSTDITGSDLARSALMLRLNKLDAIYTRNISAFCKKAAELGEKCHMRELNLESSEVSDEDLKNLSRIKSLHFLNVRHGNIKGPGLLQLAENSNLDILVLDFNPIESEYLSCFARFKKLKSLSLKNVDLTSSQKKELVKMSGNGSRYKVSF